jgi:hypothetical protein
MVFIIWDLYNTGKHESTMLDDFPIEKLTTHLAGTTGNILQINEKGEVSSVLIKVENKLNEQREKEKYEKKEKKKNFVTINKCSVNYCTEPWVSNDYHRRNSYNLYQNKKGNETETLQLIVGRSTVQIWHQIQDDIINKDALPNKGEPFLEYIWTNRISVNQEREKTKLRIDEDFKCGLNDGLHDFRLKVYWYERKTIKENSKKEKHEKKAEFEIMKEEDDEIDDIEQKLKDNNENKNIDEMEKEKRKQKIINSCVKVKRKEKIIERKIIIEKFHAVRHACRALEHLNKRYKSKHLVDNYIRVHRVSLF